ncbi:MAG: formylglycine-generating enzyme family protein [Flectobacillus sp.]|nr:formylglycine-generating enzyme family protein [Flectobacillus sp.]
MKQRIIYYIALLLLTTSCSLELVENTKSLLLCSEATGVVASAQSATPLNVAMSLTGSTSDISSVVWKITKSGTEYYRSTTTTSPFSLTSSTLSTDGTFTVTAQIVDKCGASYTLTTSYTYTISSSLSSLIIPMTYVEGGTFQMGSTTGYPNEGPVHSVTLSNFSIGKYEVTQAQWRAVMGANPSSFTNCDNCPVETVSWDDTQLFINKLNTLTGKTYRLPTEAEWEYAARGGKLSKGYTYSGSDTIDDVAWYGNNSNRTQAVGLKRANELGIYDMSGNVWEWCSDWYGSYNSSSQTNPIGSSSGTYRILRGGSWNYFPQFGRVAHRDFNTPDYLFNGFGFRVVSPQ